METNYNDLTILAHNSCVVCGTNADVYDNLCGACQNGSWLNEFRYKPEPIFHGKGKKHFGVELEVYTSSAWRTLFAYRSSQKQAAVGLTVQAFNELAYMKSDGSLDTSYGFEIVTHPMTLAYAHEKRVFDTITKLPLRAYSYESTGLHVHVSRNGITPLMCCKLAYFFAEPRNSNFINKVAQRLPNDYCRVHKKGNMKYEATGQSGRYMAVNFENLKTIEFRLFKGNIKPEAIYRAIEFVDAITEFVRVTPASKLHYTDFINYVRSQIHKTPGTTRNRPRNRKKHWRLLATWMKRWTESPIYEFDQNRDRTA